MKRTQGHKWNDKFKSRHEHWLKAKHFQFKMLTRSRIIVVIGFDFQAIVHYINRELSNTKVLGRENYETLSKIGRARACTSQTTYLFWRKKLNARETT